MKCKRWLSGLVAAAMLSTMTAGLPAVSAAETLPQPDYLFTFEQVADQAVESSGSTIAAAFLEGSAQVVADAEVPSAGGSSNVLRLSGGSNGSSYLRLPDGIFSGVNGADGLTLTMWVKPSSANGYYNRLFAANESPWVRPTTGATAGATRTLPWRWAVKCTTPPSMWDSPTKMQGSPAKSTTPLT